MPTFKLFCVICKEHIEVTAKNEKDALQDFHAQGHDNTKTKRLRRGSVGV